MRPTCFQDAGPGNVYAQTACSQRGRIVKYKRCLLCCDCVFEHQFVIARNTLAGSLRDFAPRVEYPRNAQYNVRNTVSVDLCKKNRSRHVRYDSTGSICEHARTYVLRLLHTHVSSPPSTGAEAQEDEWMYVGYV